MRVGLLLSFMWLCFTTHVQGQRFFPIKMDNKWGLINADGDVVVDPVYEAIGEFKSFGFAVMQRNGGVGLLDPSGQEVLPPKYEDIKVLHKKLAAVLLDGQWMVINMDQKTILPPGYESARVLNDRFIAFQRNLHWGVVDFNGHEIADAHYDDIKLRESAGTLYFQVLHEDYLGLLSVNGREVLAPAYEDIRLEGPELVFFKKNNKWGLAGAVSPKYGGYEFISAEFIRFYNADKSFLFSITANKLITEAGFDNYYPFNSEMAIAKRNRLLGLVNQEGEWILSPRYNEIQPFNGTYYRVNVQGKWGLVSQGDSLVLPFNYLYIAPVQDGFSFTKGEEGLGLINRHGEEIIPTRFDRINPGQAGAQSSAIQIKAYQGEALSLFQVDAEGHPVDEEVAFTNHFTISIGKKEGPETDMSDIPYILKDFEWFYSSETDKWGLRRLSDGEIQIEPAFDRISVHKDLGFTLVGMEKPGVYDFERTTYRFDIVYGLVNNEVGLLVTEVNLWDIRLNDFKKGLPLARCVFNNGRHGLISRIGKIIRKDFAYIGDFEEGIARVSVKGKLSGSMSPGEFGLGNLGDYLQQYITPSYMLDYTQYDVEFEKEARLICESCEWGFMDTTGQIQISPEYSFANDMVNEVAIVSREGLWGMVNESGKELIPCEYDEVRFLENTDNRILRIYKKAEKYGLIDTLGQVRVNMVYEEIGSFSEGFLAVRRNGLWGFVNASGEEVIQCQYRAVGNFSDGLAAVKTGRQWGFVDQGGAVVIDFSFTRIGNFRNGLAWFFEGGKYGFIDRSGTVVIPATFDKAYDFEDGIARVVSEHKYGLIDLGGRYVLRPRYLKIYEYEYNGLAKVSYGNDRIRYGLIDRRGNMVTDQGFREIRPFREGFAAVKLKDTYGFINSNGDLVVDADFTKVADFQEGRAAVHRDGRCGYIDSNGREIIQIDFSKCLDFVDGKAVVYHGYRRAGLVDREGEVLIEPSINRLYHFSEGRGLVRDPVDGIYYITEEGRMYDGYYDRASEFQHGVAVVQENGRWGVINHKGIKLVRPKYDQIESFENGYAKVRIRGLNGLTNLKGELIVQPDYEYISYAGDGIFRVEKGDKIGYFDSRGNWVWGLNQ
ncbi:MAG: WG repeat-containing protein [Bacteroidetes bacterium]|nr:WG repeat-containing protein [Bacteroidota bacterium]